VSAAFVASGTIGVIVGAQLSGNPAWAGVPSSTKQLATAFAALAVAATTDRVGRRWGLALGLAAGVLGMGLAVGAILAGGFLLFLGGSVLLGVASAAMRLGRFAAAEVHPPESRGRAISTVVIGGTVGSVVGPLLIGPSGRWAYQAGLPELAGPYLAALVLLALASLVIYIWLRPDPLDLGRRIAEHHPETALRRGPARPVSQILHTPAAVVAVSAMVFGQVVMAMLTDIVSLYMRSHQHALADISVVISAHVFGMFAFSMVAGHLTDRWGRGPVILSGTAILVLACVLAPLSPDVLPLSIALFLVGVGWNFRPTLPQGTGQNPGGKRLPDWPGHRCRHLGERPGVRRHGLRGDWDHGCGSIAGAHGIDRKVDGPEAEACSRLGLVRARTKNGVGGADGHRVPVSTLFSLPRHLAPQDMPRNGLETPLVV